MKKDLTELIFILDRSGSMAGLEIDTLGGFNSLLEKQKENPGEAIVTTVLFDDQYELLHDRAPLAGVMPLTKDDYYVRGMTALLDAIGKTIAKTTSALSHIAEEERPGKVMMIITTDGMENASKEYSEKAIKKLIEDKKELGWEFLFLGANIDSVQTAADLGINPEKAVNYRADSKGTTLNFRVLHQAVSKVRSGATLDSNWAAEIENDFNSREE